MINKYLRDGMGLTADNDAWGDVQTWCFAMAHVLYHSGDLPNRWGYRHSSCAGFEYEEDTILVALTDRHCTVEEMIYAGDILGRARDILEAMGRSY